MILNKYFLKNSSSAKHSKLPTNHTDKRSLVIPPSATAHHGTGHHTTPHIQFIHPQLGGLQISSRSPANDHSDSASSISIEPIESSKANSPHPLSSCCSCSDRACRQIIASVCNRPLSITIHNEHAATTSTPSRAAVNGMFQVLQETPKQKSLPTT